MQFPYHPITVCKYEIQPTRCYYKNSLWISTFIPSRHTPGWSRETHPTIKGFLLSLKMDISRNFIKHPALTLL
jgi:hypothetical protein